IAHGTEDYTPGTLAPQASIVITPSGDQMQDASARLRARMVERIFHDAHADRRPLLARVRVACWFGWFSYYVYLFSCIGFALIAAMEGDRGLTINPWLVLKNSFRLVNSVLSGEFDVVLQTLARLAGAPQAWLLAGGVGASYIITKLAGARMCSVYSEFWHKHQPDLRIALRTAYEQAAAKAESETESGAEFEAK